MISVCRKQKTDNRHRSQITVISVSRFQITDNTHSSQTLTRVTSVGDQCVWKTENRSHTQLTDTNKSDQCG
ncbi:hypothetical protein JCM12298_29780 [Desulfothermus naphthae]